ncbi:MAG: helix-turn-helix transcriptional regulator [Mucispirillum sp.]|nr:helix-turn-helix transcriptional regulator [Mucispirillum sp.]
MLQYTLMNINKLFATTLRNLRKSKGLTQEQLAERSDIDYKYLQKLESKNPSSPTLSVLEKLSHGLGITLTEFITFIEEGRK